MNSYRILRSVDEGVARMDNMLVVSTLKSTRFYSLVNFDHESMLELNEDSCPCFSDEPTLAISNMASVVLPTKGHPGQTHYDDSQYVVQVTSTCVLLINLFTGVRDSTWQEEPILSRPAPMLLKWSLR